MCHNVITLLSWLSPYFSQLQDNFYPVDKLRGKGLQMKDIWLMNLNIMEHYLCFHAHNCNTLIIITINFSTTMQSKLKANMHCQLQSNSALPINFPLLLIHSVNLMLNKPKSNNISVTID